MSVVLGSGEHRYRVVENWAKLPDGWEFRDVAAVAVDSKDRIYVFNRGQHPMMVFDRDGNFLRSWGEGLFGRAHGIHIDSDDNLYCTDDGDHTVRKVTTEGKVLLTIGVPNQPAPFLSGKPFNRCTHTALSPKGEIYVSDGNGKYEMQWNNMHRPCALYCCAGGGKNPKFIIGELGPGMPVNSKHTNIGPRLAIVDKKGGLIARLGGEHGPGQETGKFLSPHGLAVDSKGAIYVGEVSYTNWGGTHPGVPVPKYLRSLQKLEKVN